MTVIASFSGGKDSTAMVLRMIERGERLDEVLFCDTGVEFPAMYDHIARVREMIEKEGVAFVTLKAEKSYEWYMLEKPIESSKYGPHEGYGWPGIYSRWCTKHLKTALIEAHLKTVGGDVMQCIGIAADEERRQKPRERVRYPLAEWGWTEAVCLGYCYGKGFDWDTGRGFGLYDVFDRCSCYLCPLQNLDNLRKLRERFPDLWSHMLDLDAEVTEKSLPPFRDGDSTLAVLDRRFARESERRKGQTVLTSEEWA